MSFAVIGPYEDSLSEIVSLDHLVKSRITNRLNVEGI